MSRACSGHEGFKDKLEENGSKQVKTGLRKEGMAEE